MTKIEDLKIYFHSLRLREDGVEGVAFKISIFPLPKNPDFTKIAQKIGEALNNLEIGDD